jgi:tRNA U34 5-methylaminomethyl-2-thiouridine-forming methyltransferase MnmC
MSERPMSERPLSDYELVRLANGVHSVRARAEQETFHPVVGPVEEARQLYVEQQHLPARIAAARGAFTIWDVGLGAAANVLTVIDAAAKSGGEIHVLSFDHTLTPLGFAVEHASELKYPAGFVEELRSLIEGRAVEFGREKLKVSWRVEVRDFPTLLNSREAEKWLKPDAILFDAFSPAKNPAMWTLPLFTRLRALLDPARPCAMPTYSRSTMLRVTLLLAGFFVGAGRAIGEKDQTTIAANTLELLEAPLPGEWLKRARNSTCAEPLVEAVYRRERLSEASWERLLAHPQFNPIGRNPVPHN